MSSGSDELSKSLLQFKNGNSVHVNAWIECAAAELQKISFDKASVIIRALGHAEEKVSGDSSLDKLGRQLAETFQIPYNPHLLTKEGKTKKMATLKRDERAAAIFNRYVFAGSDVQEILVLDDILTSGATICAIKKSIRAASPPCNINFFTLAVTNPDVRINQELQSSRFRLEVEKEQRMFAKESMEFYSEGDRLRHKIRNDSFE